VKHYSKGAANLFYASTVSDGYLKQSDQISKLPQTNGQLCSILIPTALEVVCVSAYITYKS